MNVIQFTLDDVNYVNVFLAYRRESKNAFLVDCGAFTPAMSATIERLHLRLNFLLITHPHYDHTNGIAEFRKHFDLPVYAADSQHGERVSEGETIPFDDTVIRVLDTSGHTEEGVSFWIRDAVFVGDAIFSGAVGGTGNRDAFWRQNRNVAQKILTLPEETRIFCGHGAPSVVAIERLYNPFFT